MSFDLDFLSEPAVVELLHFQADGCGETRDQPMIVELMYLEEMK